MEKQIEKAYYDPEVGYLGAEKLYKKLKKSIPEIRLKDVQRFLVKQYTTQLNRPVKKPKEYSSIISKGVRNNYQIDILVYDRYAFKNYKYILCCVDVYSRYAACRPMTSRTMETIIKNINSIMEEMGWPKNINCDNEFNKKQFNELTAKHDVRVWYSEPDEINKNAIVERFNRTIAERIQLWRTATDKYDWPKVLPSLVKNYNNTVHKTIKNTPQNIFNEDGMNWQKYKVVEHKFAVGDKVRVKKKDKVFDKNDIIRYSKTIYVITRIDKSKIYISDDKTEYGPIKPYELKLANEVQYKEKEPEIDEKKEAEIHKEIQTVRRFTRSMNREGIKPQTPHELTATKPQREWRPISLDQWKTRRKQTKKK